MEAEGGLLSTTRELVSNSRGAELGRLGRTVDREEWTVAVGNVPVEQV